jgi:hypothetical protein
VLSDFRTTGRPRGWKIECCDDTSFVPGVSLSLRINKIKTFRSNSPPKKATDLFVCTAGSSFFPLHFVRVVCVRYIKESAGIISNLTPFRKKKREGRNEKTPAGVVCVCVCVRTQHTLTHGSDW